MLNAIGDSLGDLASSDDGEDGEHKDDDGEEDPELAKISEDEEPGWVIRTISKRVQHRMERFGQNQMKVDELTAPSRGDAGDYSREKDKKNGMNG